MIKFLERSRLRDVDILRNVWIPDDFYHSMLYFWYSSERQKSHTYAYPINISGIPRLFVPFRVNTTQHSSPIGGTRGFWLLWCGQCHQHTDCHHGKIDWNPPSLCVVGCLPGYWGGAPSPGCWVGWVGELNLGHWVAQAKITDLSWFRRRRGSYKAHVDQGRNKNQGQAR